MAEETEGMDLEVAAVPAQGVGAQLRAAREAKGLSVEQIAAETRIPQRHLKTIEEGRFAELPGRTYAVGFAKTYAKAVDLDQGDVAELVRSELDAQEPEGQYRPATFEPGDPARVPSAKLGWFAAFALVLLLVGGFFFFRTLFLPAAELPSLVEQERAEQQLAGAETVQDEQPAPAPTEGPVVFTALEEGIWVKFYDANGTQLMQKQMAEGERYTIPADAEGPQLWTGRPDALEITIGGRPVPKLAEDDMIMRDVPVTAEALLARNEPAATAPASPPAAAAQPTT